MQKQIEVPWRNYSVAAWLRMAATQSIVAIPDTGSTWLDLGTPERIRKAEAKIKPVTK